MNQLGSQVRIRGWGFPFADRGGPTFHENFVASEVEWQEHWETWRLYQSGMLVWFKANRWDLMSERQIKPGMVLSVGDTVFLLCEFFEFASRLALSRAGDKSMQIEVACHGLAGRHLHVDVWQSTPGRKCQAEQWSLANDYSRASLSSDARALALSAAGDLFQRFAWDASPDVLSAILGEYSR